MNSSSFSLDTSNPFANKSRGPIPNRTFGKELSNVPYQTKIAPVQRANSIKSDGFGSILQTLNDEGPLRNHQIRKDVLKEPVASFFTQRPADSGRMVVEVDNPGEKDCELLDIECSGNVQYVTEYTKDIFKYLKEHETQFHPHYGYMQQQTDINDKMRGILIDWLVDVQVKFKLLPETLFMAVNLIDRFLERSVIQRQKLQLVGVTSLFIASKYEEIYPPELKDFVFVTDKAYTRQEILDMEGKMLSLLQFNLTSTSPLRFLERFIHISKLEPKFVSFSKYMLELCIIEYKLLQYAPSLLACAAVYLSNKLSNRSELNDVVMRQAGYKDGHIKPVVHEIIRLMQGSEKSHLQAIPRKYSNPKFHEVSRIRINLLEKKHY